MNIDETNLSAEVKLDTLPWRVVELAPDGDVEAALGKTNVVREESKEDDGSVLVTYLSKGGPGFSALVYQWEKSIVPGEDPEKVLDRVIVRKTNAYDRKVFVAFDVVGTGDSTVLHNSDGVDMTREDIKSLADKYPGDSVFGVYLRE